MPDKKTRGISNLPVAIPDVPDAPTVSASNVGTSRAYNNGAATVTISSPTGGLPSSYSITTTPTTTTTVATGSTTITGLSSATSYTTTVTPSNVSATGSATTSSSFTATTVPQAPTIGAFTDGGTGTTGTLSFTAGATGGSTITGYKYSTDGTTYSAASGTTSPLSLTGLTAGTYNFSLKATNTNGDSLASGNASGTVIQPTAYESIATAVGTGSSDVITLSSIPSTYKHLQLRITGGNNFSYYAKLTFNGNTTTSNYITHYLQGNGATASAGSYTGYAGMVIAGSGGWVNPTSYIIDILDYTNTNTYRTIRGLGGPDVNGSGGVLELVSGLWMSTSSITSITLTANSGTPWTSTTKVALYGIKG
jgi:hypothetical protein